MTANLWTHAQERVPFLAPPASSRLDLGRIVRLIHWPHHRAEITGRLYVQRLSEGEIRVTTRMLHPITPLADSGILAAFDAAALDAPALPPWRPVRIIEPVAPADLDGDGGVDLGDFASFATQFGA